MRAARALLAALSLLCAAQAAAACRQALALGLDVSGSVDMWEYRLQLDGLAAALSDARVQAAFLAVPGAPVRMMVFEWSAAAHQRIVIDWREVTSPADLARIAGVLKDTRPEPVGNPATAIGAAMSFGVGQLRAQTTCWRKTLDISGDGPANEGREPRDIPQSETTQITVNGLVVGPEGRANTSKNLSNVKSLLAYYRTQVIRGPGAFAESADDYEDFANAIRRKLIRELQPPALSRAPEAPPVMQKVSGQVSELCGILGDAA